MQVLDRVVVGFRRVLAGIGTDVNEYRLGLRHLVSPVLASGNNGGQPRASRNYRLMPASGSSCCRLRPRGEGAGWAYAGLSPSHPDSKMGWVTGRHPVRVIVNTGQNLSARLLAPTKFLVPVLPGGYIPASASACGARRGRGAAADGRGRRARSGQQRHTPMARLRSARALSDRCILVVGQAVGGDRPGLGACGGRCSVVIPPPWRQTALSAQFVTSGDRK